jgi:hypothetical protein
MNRYLPLPANPLQPSQENIARARRKFKDLAGSINRHIQSNPYSIRVLRDAELSHVIAHRDIDLDIDVAFDCVEIVQRLRAALDKAVVALVELNERGTSGVGFPFGGIDRNTGQPEKFPSDRIKKKLEEKLTPEQWNFICAQRPYPTGNDTLWAINEIANEDKHRKDLVSVEPHLHHGFAIASGYIDKLFVKPNDFQHLLADANKETVLMSMGQAVSQLQMQHQFSVSVVFGLGFGVDRRNVLSTLNEQIRQTEHIVGSMRALAG